MRKIFLALLILCSLFTKGQNDHLVLSYAPPVKLDTIFYQNTWTNTNDFIGRGGSYPYLVAGKIRDSSSTSSFGSLLIYKYWHPTMLNTWKYEIQVKVISATAGNLGFAPAFICQDPTDNAGIVPYILMNGSGSMVMSRQDGTSLSTSGSGPSMSINDILVLTLTKNDSTISYSAKNLTTSSSTTTITYNYLLTGSIFLPNTSLLAILNSSGTYELQSILYQSNETKNPTGLIFGASQMQGYKVGTFNKRTWVGANTSWPTVNLYSGQGGKLTDALSLYEEYNSINPEWVLLLMGPNDIRSLIAGGKTMAQATAIAAENHRVLYNKLTRGGSTRVIPFVIPEDTTSGGSPVGCTAFKNWLVLQYPQYASFINGVWNGLGAGTNVLSATYQGDKSHPNAAGDSLILSQMQLSGFFTAATSRTAPIIAGDNQFTITGNVIHAVRDLTPTPNYIMRIDSVSGGWVPSGIHDDGTKLLTTSKSLTAVIPTTVQANSVQIDDKFLELTGSGNNALLLHDRVTNANYFSMYASNSIQVWGYNGAQIGFLGSTGKFLLGDNTGLPVPTGILQIRHTVTPLTYLGGTNKKDGAVIDGDTSSFVMSLSSSDNAVGYSFKPPSFSFGSAAAVTKGVNVRIPGPLLNGGGPVTFTTNLSLEVESGESRFDDLTNHTFIGGNAASISFAAGAGAGSIPTITTPAFDAVSGTVQVIAGTSPTAGATIVTITIPTQKSANFKVLVNCNTCLGIPVDARATSSTTFIIKASAAGTVLNAGSTYKWDWFIIQ